jgi:Zn-dependent protease
MTTTRRIGWPLGHVAGIELRMHPSFLLLVGLALLGLFGPPIDGLAWIALLFGSIIVHELGHAIVARHLGLQVRDIVLLPIGGASEIDGLQEDPRHELTIAIVGPITSFALAAVTAAGLVVTGVGVSAPSLASGSLVQRGMWANLMLGAFNLLPALPMDGGRVLRAWLAQRVGLEEATRRAVRTSRRLAVAMGAIGLFAMPFLVVIAVFVYVSARAEEVSAIVHGRLAGLVVHDVMTPVPNLAVSLGTVTLREDDALEGVLEELASAPDGIATVVDADGRITGVLLTRRVAELVERSTSQHRPA